VPVKRVPTNAGLEAQDLTQMPNDNLRKYRAVFAMGRGVAWSVAQTFNGTQQLPVTSAESGHELIWAAIHSPENAWDSTSDMSCCCTHAFGLAKVELRSITTPPNAMTAATV
jgi:hypothetical protein